MIPPGFSALLSKLKLQIKSDFGYAAERLRLAPSREKRAFQVFSLMAQSEKLCEAHKIPAKEFHCRLNDGLVKAGWPDQASGRIDPVLEAMLSTMRISALSERAFRLQLAKLRAARAAETLYILSHLKDVSKTHAEVAAEIADEVAHGRIFLRHPTIKR